MRKMKKIITLAMTLVMMMAMSITAFATNDEAAAATATAASTLTVKNVEAGATVSIYELAEVTAAGEVKVTADWAKSVYKTKDAVLKDGKYTMPQMGADDALNLKVAFDNSKENLQPSVPPLTADSTKEVEFTGLKKGAYFVDIAGEEYVYTAMVGVTFAINEATGAYVTKDEVVVAKGTKDDLTKTNKPVDKIVSANQQSVEFTVEKEVPSNVTKFILHDKTENLSSLEESTVTVKVGETVVAAPNNGTWKFVKVANTDNQFKLDLTSLVANYANQKVTVVYSANVIGAKGYANTADYETPGHDPDFEKHIVEGYTGRFTLTKYGENQAKLADAEFIGTYGEQYVVATLADGVYTFVKFTSDKKEATTFVTSANGQFVVDGLDTGVYSFTETKAPATYAVNTNPVTVEVKASDDEFTNAKSNVEGERVYLYTGSLTDSTLIQLPFTGGMGTTIFTILGVAIMAMAAALFFATKKSR